MYKATAVPTFETLWRALQATINIELSEENGIYYNDKPVCAGVPFPKVGYLIHNADKINLKG